MGVPGGYLRVFWGSGGYLRGIWGVMAVIMVMVMVKVCDVGGVLRTICERRRRQRGREVGWFANLAQTGHLHHPSPLTTFKMD